MKVAYLTGIRQLEILDAPEPRLTHPREVLLRMDTVGVCGSDVHYYTAGRIGTQVVQFPERVGHECAGTAVEVGSAVTEFEAGQRVAVDPLVACGRCDQCRSGRQPGRGAGRACRVLGNACRIVPPRAGLHDAGAGGSG